MTSENRTINRGWSTDMAKRGHSNNLHLLQSKHYNLICLNSLQMPGNGIHAHGNKPPLCHSLELKSRSTLTLFVLSNVFEYLVTNLRTRFWLVKLPLCVWGCDWLAELSITLMKLLSRRKQVSRTQWDDRPTMQQVSKHIPVLFTTAFTF